jgi:hypothetical protein
MKCVAGHQPNLYPYGGFFAKATSVDIFVIVDNTQYVKKEFHNRNRILLRDGKVIWLSIPVKNAGNYKKKINEMEIDNSIAWKRKHLKSIYLNYKTCPFFEEYFEGYENLLKEQWDYLTDYNIAFIKYCFESLRIKTPVLRGSEIKICGKSSELILDICKKTNSQCYLHGKHARDYVDFEYLRTNGIKNLIQDFTPRQYPQNNHRAFTPNLSILDILFNLGKDTLDFLQESQKILMEQ